MVSKEGVRVIGEAKFHQFAQDFEELGIELGLIHALLLSGKMGNWRASVCHTFVF